MKSHDLLVGNGSRKVAPVGPWEALFIETVTRVTEGRGGGGPEDCDTLPSRGPAVAVAAKATASEIAKKH